MGRNMKDREKIKIKGEHICADYFDEFACIGSDCEDTCCIGVEVEIDRDTYVRLKNIDDEKLKKIIKCHVYENEQYTYENLDFAKVKLTKDRYCPFLNGKKLCMLQTTLGEEYLSNTCYSFPRYINLIDGVYESTMALSCPEAARTVLLKKDGIIFDVTSNEPRRGKIVSVIDTDDDVNKDAVMSKLTELRDFAIWVMQRREFNIWERLLMLGYFHEDLEICIKKGNIHKIGKLIDSYRLKIKRRELTNLIEKTINIPSMQITLLMEYIERLIAATEIENERFAKATREVEKALAFNMDIEMRKRQEIFMTSVGKHYEPLMDEHEYILENYFVNHMFKNLYPFSEPGTPFDSYMMVVIRYALIKVYLVGIGASRGKLTCNMVIDFIQMFVKTAEQHKTYLMDLADFMRDSGFDNMEYMNILLKSDKRKYV